MIRIYLSGGMTGLEYEEYAGWRDDVYDRLLDKADTYKDQISIFNPIEYFNYENRNDFRNEKQVMRMELNELRSSDLVIVNFNSPGSIGTACEIATAYELKIPVVGIHEDSSTELHPWLQEYCDVIFDSVDEAVSYVTDYILW